MTWGTRGRAQHSMEAVLGTFLGEPVLPCLMDFQGFWWTWSEQLKTCIVHSQSLRNTCETQLSGKGREPKFMFPKKVYVFAFQFYFSRILLGFLRFTRPLKASPGEDGRWGGRRGEMGVIPRSGCSTGLALWVFSHIAGDNKSQHDRAFQDFLTPPLQFQKRNLLTCFFDLNYIIFKQHNNVQISFFSV